MKRRSVQRFAGLVTSTGPPAFPSKIPTSYPHPRKFCDSMIHAAPKPEALPQPPSEWMSSYPLPLTGIPPELYQALQQLRSMITNKAC
ncbi:hypothetical protein FGIG_08152 [Fasciola gigantica]|uniref:Uncharacterized protein n=1 Tax=Fasciola gigantica TaxID=46835 RepID=A0A504Z1B9_FASGI|nr:hypothetical protein FGIG_08152 [Fasciola gigantica]